MLIVRTVERWLRPLFLIFSLYLLLRGHNAPGGGFVGGLVAAVPFALHALVRDVPSARRILIVEPRLMMGLGLACAMGSGVISLLLGQPYLTGIWAGWHIPGMPQLVFGTPLLFDMGVYLAVMGVTLTIILSLAED